MVGPIRKTEARRVLADAIELARSDGRLPVEWTSHSRAVFELEEMTWTPAFATMLLAKSVNENVDVFSLKEKVSPPNPMAYSARGLCHGVIVPAALKYRFSIRNTGAEPLNNSPFAAASIIQDIKSRAKNSENYEYFYAVTKRVEELSGADALKALAAFLREAIAVTAASENIKLESAGLTAFRAQVAIKDFLRFDAEARPKRLQAFAAACLDLVFQEVKSRRLNDPSRDHPGDVHVVLEETVGMAVEVRGKAVTDSDLESFARRCEAADIDRAVLLVSAINQQVLDPRRTAREVGLTESQISVFEDVHDLFQAVLLWTDYSLLPAVEIFSERMLVRLREIEGGTSMLQEWKRAVAVAQGL